MSCRGSWPEMTRVLKELGRADGTPFCNPSFREALSVR
jgi:hypothetical protein